MKLLIDADALNRRRRRFLPAVQYIICVKDNDGSVIVSAHASILYAV
jgi:hypothetical protein